MNIIFSFAFFAACGSDDGEGVDFDGDGVVESQDCDDQNRFIYPGAPEACDLIDNDCDDTVDEGWDNDGDGFTACGGDCADGDANSNPNATEVLDGRDNDCDMIVDNNTDAYDDDGDGVSEDQGDCNDADPTQNPFAAEISALIDGTPEGVDNNCNGMTDEEVLCETDTGSDSDVFAAAIGICQGNTGTTLEAANTRSWNVEDGFGNTYTAAQGGLLGVLSTGFAVDVAGRIAGDPGNEPGSTFGQSTPHPNPIGTNGCTGPDPTNVFDMTEFAIELRVPPNAGGFAVDYNFMSADFPEQVCTNNDDTFLLILETSAASQNIAFDSNVHYISTGTSLITHCNPALPNLPNPNPCGSAADLTGTGFETLGGGTGWLRTQTSAIIPGEIATLRFVIFDEGGDANDSTVLIDNFRWLAEDNLTTQTTTVP